jgi:hypothetical protein
MEGGGSFSFAPNGAATLYLSFGHVTYLPAGSLTYNKTFDKFGACPQYQGNGTCEYVIIEVNGESPDGTTTVSGEYTVESIHAAGSSSNKPYSGGLTINRY